MKKRMLFVIIVSILILVSFNTLPSNTEKHSLTITVNNLRNSKGVVQFALYNKEGSIPDEKFKKYYKINTTIITNNTATKIFSNLPKGMYAVSVLHDENQNSKIDKRFIFPKEGIGFSNYKSIGLRNRPKFSKASFEVHSDIKKVITIIYF